MTDLFEASGIHPPDAPLADRLRPRSLDEVVGQDHLLGEGGPIRRMRAASNAFFRSATPEKTALSDWNW